MYIYSDTLYPFLLILKGNWIKTKPIDKYHESGKIVPPSHPNPLCSYKVRIKRRLKYGLKHEDKKKKKKENLDDMILLSSKILANL